MPWFGWKIVLSAVIFDICPNDLKGLPFGEAISLTLDDRFSTPLYHCYKESMCSKESTHKSGNDQFPLWLIRIRKTLSASDKLGDTNIVCGVDAGIGSLKRNTS